jgi:hypothetical protein
MCLKLVSSLKRLKSYLDGLLVWHVDVDGQVSEGLGQGSTGSLDGNDPGLDANVNALKKPTKNFQLKSPRW